LVIHRTNTSRLTSATSMRDTQTAHHNDLPMPELSALQRGGGTRQVEFA
jgi:hypothetical protein